MAYLKYHDRLLFCHDYPLLFHVAKLTRVHLMADHGSLDGCADANWHSPCSTTGTITCFNCHLITRQSKRQKCTAMCMGEAEYFAISAEADELI